MCYQKNPHASYRRDEKFQRGGVGGLKVQIGTYEYKLNFRVYVSGVGGEGERGEKNNPFL